MAEPPLELVTAKAYRTAGVPVTFFSTFVLTYGLMLASMAVMAAWLFRSSSAPLWAKVGLPILVVALACVTPLEVNPMMGLPVTVSLKSLPDQAQLIAFLPHDEAQTGRSLAALRRRPAAVVRDAARRADEEDAARGAAGNGQRSPGDAGEAKTGEAQRHGSTNGLANEQTEYVLDDSVRSALPPKE